MIFTVLVSPIYVALSCDCRPDALVVLPTDELETYKELVEQFEVEKAGLRQSLHEAKSVIDSAQLLLTENLRLSKQCDMWRCKYEAVSKGEDGAGVEAATMAVLRSKHQEIHELRELVVTLGGHEELIKLTGVWHANTALRLSIIPML